MKATLGISVVALLACLMYSYPALSQVQGSSCATVNEVYSPYYGGHATGSTFICDGSLLQTLMTATASPLQLSILGPVAIGTTSQTTGTALDLGTNTNSMLLPSGTTAQRPSGVNGMLRFNSSSTGSVEAYYNSGWNTLLTSASLAGSTINLG